MKLRHPQAENRFDRIEENLQNGASVSVNGVCLTVVAIEKEHVRFDVIRET